MCVRRFYYDIDDRGSIRPVHFCLTADAQTLNKNICYVKTLHVFTRYFIRINVYCDDDVNFNPY